jgi:hypothetical protein
MSQRAWSYGCAFLAGNAAGLAATIPVAGAGAAIAACMALAGSAVMGWAAWCDERWIKS